MEKMIIPLAPVATPRPRVSKFGTYYPPKYKKYKRELSVLLADIEPTNSIKINFYFARPLRLGLGKRVPHDVRPDIDNLIKGVLDCVPFDDKIISSVDAKKFYCGSGEEPFIEIQIVENNDV